MKLTNYINQVKGTGTSLSLSAQPSKQYKVKSKSGIESLPYWYGIKPIRFIWRGEWAGADILYNRMVVPAVEIEDAMYELYKEEGGQDDMTSDGFATFMRENKYLIVDSIKQFHKNCCN